jgi:hypothetical protein
MWRSLIALGVAMVLAGVIPATAQEPEWQTHAKWCTTDGGSSGAAYRSTCRSYDQFDSVIACQAHNPGAIQKIREAGRSTVNAYMESYRPKECKGTS